MDNEKFVVEKRNYYCFYDLVANDYGEPFKARTNAEALRAFHLSICQQKSKGSIVDEEDYKLFKLYSMSIYSDGSINMNGDYCEVIDNEFNNKE